MQKMTELGLVSQSRTASLSEAPVPNPTYYLKKVISDRNMSSDANHCSQGQNTLHLIFQSHQLFFSFVAINN